MKELEGYDCIGELNGLVAFSHKVDHHVRFFDGENERIVEIVGGNFFGRAMLIRDMDGKILETYPGKR